MYIRTDLSTKEIAEILKKRIRINKVANGYLLVLPHDEQDQYFVFNKFEEMTKELKDYFEEKK